jgi:large subunit ribosomal protein LP1
MSCQSYTEMSEIQKNQLATNLAALILHDSGKEVTCENLSKVLNNSGLKVPGYWSNLMSKALEGKSVGDFL